MVREREPSVLLLQPIVISKLLPVAVGLVYTSIVAFGALYSMSIRSPGRVFILMPSSSDMIFMIFAWSSSVKL